MNPWSLELLVVREQALDLERRSLARDCVRGLLHRVRPGVYVEREGYKALTVEGSHVVAMRALAAVAPEPPQFSHWSAAVLHGLPTLGQHLDRVHVTVQDPARRGSVGVGSHVAPLDVGETIVVGTLRATAVPRTVVDVALASPFEAGVVIADGSLHAGCPEAALQEGAAGAAGRRGWRRAQQVVAFARAEAESAAESRARVTMLRIGIRPPVLQWRVADRRGLAGRLDFGFPWVPAGGEVDGEKKYRDAAMASSGAADAVIAEKWREDRVRLQVPLLARWGYRESGSTVQLCPILARIGVTPERPRVTIADYSSAFRLVTF
ncbi:hypothetical protein [uncultured Amnibacterium sp.]|uniref:hypothetical protein n=1 Tax=uncultured Amnibacterium sp. TaxID=1631851 RepID=UPI0035C9F42C